MICSLGFDGGVVKQRPERVSSSRIVSELFFSSYFFVDFEASKRSGVGFFCKFSKSYSDSLISRGCCSDTVAGKGDWVKWGFDADIWCYFK